LLQCRDPSPFAARLDAILREHQEFRSHVVPLCAAETPVSDYVRSFMVDPIHEKYAMGGPLLPASENFIGAQYVLDLHQLTIDLCREIFGATYADPRPLSGTSAVTNLLMTLSEPGQRILLQTSASGGHASMAPICRRLGLEIVDLPYDYDRFQIDARACWNLVDTPIDFVLFAPSDILYAPDLGALGFAETTTVVYDATQTLGLIASGHLPCPLNVHPRLVISAGTHKTLPGPSSGLLMTQNEEIAARIDSELSPKFVRHSQPHHMASLCATLIEHRAVGSLYSGRIQAHAKALSAALADEGLNVLQDSDRITETHQVFLQVAASQLDAAYRRAAEVGITLNKKCKPLFRDAGLRLGVQEIARYRWSDSDVARLAGILAQVVTGTGVVGELRTEVRALAQLNVFADDMCLLPATQQLNAP
jgi:glycine hydroxymethyltransferase